MDNRSVSDRSALNGVGNSTPKLSRALRLIAWFPMIGLGYIVLEIPVSCVSWGRQIRPPASLSLWNVESHIAVREYRTIKTSLSSGGEIFFAAIGPRPGSILSSGPPVYVFDGDGKLLDWTPDFGDDSQFRNNWDISGFDAVSRAELRDHVQRNRSRDVGN